MNYSKITSFESGDLFQFNCKSARCIHMSTHTHIYIRIHTHIVLHLYLIPGCSDNSMHANMHTNEQHICTDATDTVNEPWGYQPTADIWANGKVKFTDQKRAEFTKHMVHIATIKWQLQPICHWVSRSSRSRIRPLGWGIDSSFFEWSVNVRNPFCLSAIPNFYKTWVVYPLVMTNIAMEKHLIYYR